MSRLFFIEFLIVFFILFSFQSVAQALITMWKHSQNSCICSQIHILLSNLSFFDSEIEMINIFDCNCFCNVITLAWSIVFSFFLTTFLYSRIVSSKWTFLHVARFCKIQLSQKIETHFRSTIRNFSTNIVSESKKFFISSFWIRILRLFHFVI
jgi:hypothetical protein